MTQPIKLGNIVRDVASGFSGMATMKVEMLDGSTQYGIQPKVKAGEDADMKLPDAILVDVQVLEFVEDGIAAQVPAHPQTPLILGQQVKDEITGLKGMIIDRIFHLNGCVHYTVAPKIGADGKWTRSVQFDWKRLKVVGKGVSETITRKGGGETPATNKSADEHVGARTRGGAPMSRAPSYAR